MTLYFSEGILWEYIRHGALSLLRYFAGNLHNLRVFNELLVPKNFANDS